MIYPYNDSSALKKTSAFVQASPVRLTLFCRPPLMHHGKITPRRNPTELIVVTAGYLGTDLVLETTDTTIREARGGLGGRGESSQSDRKEQGITRRKGYNIAGDYWSRTPPRGHTARGEGS